MEPRKRNFQQVIFSIAHLALISEGEVNSIHKI